MTEATQKFASFSKLPILARALQDKQFRRWITTLSADLDLQQLLNRVSQDVSDKVLVGMLLDLKDQHPDYACYFESMLKSWQSKPNLDLWVELTSWLANQPAEFHTSLQPLHADQTLRASFYKALRTWGDQKTLQEAQAHSRVRELYLRELFPSIVDIRVAVGVIHEESHHPNQVDMAYVCAIAGCLQAKQIFEFGTYRGQTTCGLASSAPDATIYTLNLPPEADPRYAPFIGMYIKQSSDQHRIKQLFHDSYQFDPSPYAQSMDYIFIDADHSYAGVKNDTEKALVMLKPGGTLVWHDYAAKSPGVYTYIQELSQSRPVFRIRNTCLIVYRDGVDVDTFEPAPMVSSLENTEYTPDKATRL
jgi:predicted O-methyltransferase YrrM